MKYITVKLTEAQLAEVAEVLEMHLIYVKDAIPLEAEQKEHYAFCKRLYTKLVKAKLS